MDVNLDPKVKEGWCKCGDWVCVACGPLAMFRPKGNPLALRRSSCAPDTS
jgi:hypothetical protein